MTRAGFPHSDTAGSQLGCQLPRAYRRLQRPSSALDAKASTMCPSQLAKQTLNKNNNTTAPKKPAPRHQQTFKSANNTAKTHTTKTNTHTKTTPKNQGPTVRAMLASTIQKSRN